jgi:hypothetical protein
LVTLEFGHQAGFRPEYVSILHFFHRIKGLTC